jgi:hypothetical protein
MSLRWLRQCSKTNEVENDEWTYPEGLAGVNLEIQGHCFLHLRDYDKYRTPRKEHCQGVFNQSMKLRRVHGGIERGRPLSTNDLHSQRHLAKT